MVQDNLQTPPETLQHHPAAGGVTVHREKLMGERCQRSHRPLQRRCSIILQQVVSLCTGRSLWESDARGATDSSRDAAASSCSRWCHCAPGEAYGRAMPEEPQTPPETLQHHPAAGGVTVHREKLMGERCQRSHRLLQRRCSIILQQVVSLCTGRSLWQSDAREATDPSRDAAASSCSRWCHCAPGEAYGRAMPEKPQTPPETRSIILQQVVSLCTGRSLWESDAREATDSSRDAAASSCSRWCHCAPGEAYGRAMPEKPQTPPETRSIILQQVVSLCTGRSLWQSDAREATDPPETRSIILQQVVSLCTGRSLWQSDARGATDSSRDPQHHPAAGGVTVHREKLMAERCQRSHRPLQRRCSIILQQVVSLCTGRSLWQSDARGATDPSRDPAASSCSRWCHCAPGEAYGRAMPEKPQTPPETRSIILQQVVSLCTGRSLWESDAREATDPSRDAAASSCSRWCHCAPGEAYGRAMPEEPQTLQRRCSIILQQVVSLCTGRSLWESDARGATDPPETLQHHPAAGGVTVHREKLMGERCQRSHRPLQRPAASSCSRWCHCAPGEAYGRAMPEKPQTPPETLQHHPAAGGVTVHREKLMGERCQRSHRLLQRPAASSCSRWCHCAPGEAYGRAMPEEPQTPPETLQHHPAAGGVTVHREKLMGERCQRSHRPLQRPAASSCSRWCHCAPGEAYGRAMPEKPHTEAPEGCRRRSCALMRQRLSCLVIQKGVVHSGQKTQQENHLLPPIRFG
ncbi:uncharacterized protein [Engystomops pustulosus]|uniref:uncharacterized protein isoform X11 n=1 Tax=Engystomops pustulosus TaxID=76066 RepID=UPI003AFADE7B